MINKFPFTLMILLLVMFLLTSCNPEANLQQPETPDLTQILLPMGYIPNVQYAPFYAAVQQGFFSEEGLEIEFDYSFETDGVALVAANELPFALVSGEQVLLAREQGMPLVYVFEWYQRFPVAIATKADSGIETPSSVMSASLPMASSRPSTTALPPCSRTH